MEAILNQEIDYRVSYKSLTPGSFPVTISSLLSKNIAV